MILPLEGRDKVNLHLIANKLNEVINLLNEKEVQPKADDDLNVGDIN